MTTLYLVRHGRTNGNFADIAQGHYDAHLDEQGRAQAQLLAERIKDWHFDAVYCSDSTRTQQTAAPFLNLRPDLDFETTPELREKFYGECENQPWQKLWEKYPDTFAQLIDPSVGIDVRLPGAETDREHINRVGKFTDRIIAQHDDDAEILVFSHGGSIKAAASYICDINTEAMWRLKTDNTSISALISDISWRGQKWQIKTWNDINHLNGLHQAPMNNPSF